MTVIHKFVDLHVYAGWGEGCRADRVSEPAAPAHQAAQLIRGRELTTQAAALLFLFLLRGFPNYLLGNYLWRCGGLQGGVVV